MNSHYTRMQQNIESFFKKSVPASSVHLPPPAFGDDLVVWGKQHCVQQTSKHRAIESVTRKRSYGQFHLEFGQSDFLMRTCSECGMKYSPGDQGDEKAHMEFHKNYTHGIRFKGWCNERILNVQGLDDFGRIIFVQNCDPPAKINKVKDIVKMMEIDLGYGWIYHKLCKVYLFVAAHKIVGCLVAEPIKEAFRVVSSLEKFEHSGPIKKEARTRVEPSPLPFGNIILKRELVKKDASVKKNDMSVGKPNGATFCEEKAIPVTCGIRAIWVAPYHRRKHIATRLLEAARFSFSGNGVLDRHQLAFSQATEIGKALAFSYMGDHLLVYKSNEDRRQLG
ncbi:hypothetical protein MLD38_015054 [Melastoma candidum]|uniref:Uncharacterized protein n=1 Tax=Melastoma candidum TaxID=119954 RepID=A0ACB9REP7_9MYRT|nr:hypothetical protein MLD38_015054 [Melastoma candidum]